MSDAAALRCYVCGKPIAQFMSLCWMGTMRDRVFVAHGECSEQMDGCTILPVRREEPTTPKASGKKA